MKPPRTIIFAKAPRPGFAKTRLIPALGEHGAARLAQQLLTRTLAAALAARTGPVELCATPARDHPDWSGIDLPAGITVTEQCAGDLGARLAHATRRCIANGQAALLIGTDCPEMSSTLLREAAARLRAADALIHPTADGGYAMLGLRRFDASLFERIAWSTDTVAATTVARAQALGWHIQTGKTLHDIDEPRDLIHLSAIDPHRSFALAGCQRLTVPDR